MTATPDRLHPWTRLAARTGSIAFNLGAPILVLVGLGASVGLLDVLPRPLSVAIGIATLPALGLFVLGMAAGYLPRPLDVPTLGVRSPIRGRCSALNGPATKVPSHGMHLLGQTYAIDLLHEPEPGARPTFGGRRAMRDPHEYPSFGQPAYAPVDGEVVRTHDGARDHRCRSNLLGFAYLMVEGLVRQSLGVRAMVGNHVVVRAADGSHLVVAHLKRGSVRVAPGDVVVAGQPTGEVGNSGNSSEPHVHLHRQDVANPRIATGLPIVFTDVVVDDALTAPQVAATPLVPEDQVIFHAGAATEPVEPHPQG